jgi:hypothetical protein
MYETRRGLGLAAGNSDPAARVAFHSERTSEVRMVKTPSRGRKSRGQA